MAKYTCNCCDPAKSYSRSDKLYKHRQRYDPKFIDYKSLAELRKLEYSKFPKLCVTCEAPIEFENRSTKKYCSRSCAATTNDRLFPKRTNKLKMGLLKNEFCFGCKTPLKNSQPKWCSRQCQIEFTLTDNISKFISGENMSYSNDELKSWCRTYLIDQANGKCSNCSWSEVHSITGKVPLQIDHIDGNYKNNTINNLRVLCPNCHSLTPNFGSLNTGNGRPKRRRLHNDLSKVLQING